MSGSEYAPPSGSESRWAIVGRHGLYTGWWFTRAEAISKHVNDKLIVPSRSFPNERIAWRFLRSRGDRAVRVTIQIQNTALTQSPH